MIKASEIRDTVRRLGLEYPETKRECRYFNPDGTPCCLVGTALAIHGMEPDTFLAELEFNRFTNVSNLFHDYADKFGLLNDLTDEEFTRLAVAQKRQDQGDIWGQAVRGL